MPLYLLTVDASSTPTAPDVTPTARVYSGATLVTTRRLPVFDRYATTTPKTMFNHEMYLDGRFSTGRYDVTYNYVIGGTAYVEDTYFEIVAAGHTDGHIHSMSFYHKPHADFVVWMTSGGKLQRGRNPYV